jgi:hypothetical protein
MKCVRGFHLTALDHGLSMTGSKKMPRLASIISSGRTKGMTGPAVPGWTGIRSAVVWNEVLLNTANRRLLPLRDVAAVLMGPAMLSVYAFAVWALTAEMGWTNSFPFAAGPLSNWIIWALMAVLLHFAFVTLRRQLKWV